MEKNKVSGLDFPHQQATSSFVPTEVHFVDTPGTTSLHRGDVEWTIPNGIHHLTPTTWVAKIQKVWVSCWSQLLLGLGWLGWLGWVGLIGRVGWLVGLVGWRLYVGILKILEGKLKARSIWWREIAGWFLSFFLSWALDIHTIKKDPRRCELDGPFLVLMTYQIGHMTQYKNLKKKH